MNRLKVLLVEDEGIVAMGIEDQMLHAGYDVVGLCSSGEQALEAARSLCPDVVLMDIRLKGEMDGVQAADIIIREYGIAVVFLSASEDYAGYRHANDLGHSGFLKKPVSEEELRATLDTFVPFGTVPAA